MGSEAGHDFVHHERRARGFRDLADLAEELVRLQAGVPTLNWDELEARLETVTWAFAVSVRVFCAVPPTVVVGKAVAEPLSGTHPDASGGQSDAIALRLGYEYTPPPWNKLISNSCIFWIY